MPPRERHADLGLLLLRLYVGAFLIWGVSDNLLSAQHMQEFEQFLAKFGFPWPAFMARLSVFAQLLIGLSFVTGVGFRWAGLVCALHFVIAIAMVDRFGGIRASFPAGCLVMLGIYFALRGPGRYAIDWPARRARRL